MYRLLGHQRSVLSLLVVEEKKWLVSSSSKSYKLALTVHPDTDAQVPETFGSAALLWSKNLTDTQIWSTLTLQPIYIIHPCDDTAGDIYSLAWDKRAGGTLYLGEHTPLCLPDLR